ncbi:hypothetical protein QBC38DRAFT_155242 [Podospora fimiseda]|uniref:ubiquitinyl hydrolase 1 n=1 Tax=Podospora fimiseda TaxID=252190 RepID=A0AAN6YR94_9PEZI|nr:hypothetical protein QBC38DRAFT_155242 [Podospora fimiseda]
MAIEPPAQDEVDEVDASTLEFLMSHVFLPPRLPQKDDTNKQHQIAMTQVLRDSISKFMAAEHRSSPSLQPALEMVGRFLSTSTGPDLNETDTTHRNALHNGISNLQVGDVAVFYLRDQNAGLLLTCQQEDVVFEAFRLLAPNNDVMSCKGALLREFPERAAAVPIAKLRDPELLDQVVDVIQELEFNVASVARPQVTKANSARSEERDTLSSLIATGLLIDVLVGLGREVDPDRITKRSREQVSYSNALHPFHRSPTWLLLRVALRLVLDRIASLNGEQSWYKALMAYHHARILKLACQETKASVSSDHLFSMKAKLIRRIVKLDPAQDARSGWLNEVQKVVVQAQAILTSRWNNVQDEDNEELPLHHLFKASFHHDTELKLDRLRKHVSWIESRDSRRGNDMEQGDITRFHTLSHTELPSLHANTPEDAVVGRCELLDFEAWVESSLSGWSASSSCPNKVAVNSLGELLETYYRRASIAYKDVPEALSVMYLVIMELWIAMDKIAGKEIPLLLDYDPGFPSNLFYLLLLEKKDQMRRVYTAEKYLASRRARAPPSYRSAFTNFGHDRSLAVRFYRSSEEHQRLHERIKDWDAYTKEEKLKEYETKMKEYCALVARMNETVCTSSWSSRWQSIVHDANCKRCWLEEKKDAITIAVYEEPLPATPSHAQAAVFEISVPPIVSRWRDVTWKLIAEVFCDTSKHQNKQSREKLYFATQHSGMARFLKRTSGLQPASTVKPMEVTHYGKPMLITDATHENICVWHAAKYKYYDRPSNVMTENTAGLPDVCIPRHCSYAELVHGDPVEDWVRSTKHTQNDVIAAQHRCPPDVTLREFRDFGYLRSNVRLQWANILVQLSMPSIDFNRKQTLALILQACLELGPRDVSECAEFEVSLAREAHGDTQKHSFMSQIIAAMRDALERICESWQNDIALCVLTCMATRLLFLSPTPMTSSLLVQFLEELRKVSITWARVLLGKLNESIEIEDRQRWISKLLVAALTCGTTFDMEVKHLELVLKDSNNLSHLVESAVLARNYLPASGKPSDSDGIALQLMHRWHIVMYRARHIVAKQVTKVGNQGLDFAIKQFWADYSPSLSVGWKQADLNGRSHILTQQSGAVEITFNLLTGHLFLNGCPLSKLPSSYQRHPTFTELFGQQILDVGPSSVQGMEFSASRKQSGWVLHFGLRDGKLVVRAARHGLLDDGCEFTDPPRLQPETWEYIPRKQIVGDLPNSFIFDYSHWLNISTGQLEFRPIAKKWESAPETNWCLTRENGKHILRKESRIVTDPSSATAVLSHKVLQNIESSGHIDVIFDTADKTLTLDLPRLSISFRIRQGETALRSMNYTSMVVDEHQGVNSLVGLIDKLVLKPERGSGFRMILVPRGQVSARMTDVPNHVKVSIQRDNDKRVYHDSYLVDTKLGCLKGTGSLPSRFYLCLLHALTSHCLPDPLTFRTGTEEALRILQGADVRSYPALDEVSLNMLAEIAQISPTRVYYPSHLESMEEIGWNISLPALSQHDDFWPLAKSIYCHYDTCRQLFRAEGSGRLADTASAEVFTRLGEHRSSKLTERARIRNAVFRVSEFGAEGHTTDEDTWYRPSEETATGSNKREGMVAQLARCVDKGTQCLIFEPSLGLPSKVEAVNGTNFSGNPFEVTLRFDLGNFRVPSTTLKGLWSGLHRKLITETNKYKKIFFLSTLFYARDSDPDIVQTLMAFSTISVFRKVNMLPPSGKFNLNINRSTLRNNIMNIVNSGKKNLEECGDYPSWTQSWGESVRSFEERREVEWRKKLNATTAEFVNNLTRQTKQSWVVHIPESRDYQSYLHIDQIAPAVLAVVEMARRSEAFKLYLASLSTAMGKLGILDSFESAIFPNRVRMRPLSRPGFVSASSLFSQPAPRSEFPRPDIFPNLLTEAQQLEQNHARLSDLVDSLLVDGNLQPYQASYLDELRCSMASPIAKGHGITIPDNLVGNLDRALEVYNSLWRALQLGLMDTSIASQLCKDAGLYPRISPMFVLQRLTRTFWAKLSNQWRTALINLALSVVYLQRAERLQTYGSDLTRHREDLQRELSNLGDHDNPEWNPLEYPESLLLEIEQGIMIRPVQNKIASSMRSPPGMQNSVMQLNMGEGKSSVIVPIVSAALANGKQLVRVLVAKPQSSQMTHLLISKLGGLMNRQVFYLPFSRSIELSHHGVLIAREMIDKCKSEGGVLLVQPEHLLSFKLMGIDKSWAAEDEQQTTEDLGKSIIALYQDFEASSRDIVDESDENFSIKFELIYTMGTQEAVEMSPKRWELIQQLLAMVESVIRELMEDKSNSSREPEVLDGFLVHDSGAGRVLLLRVLNESAGRYLVTELASRVCNRGLIGFPVHNQTPRMRQAVHNYILVDRVDEVDIALVEDAHTGLFTAPAIRDALLLLRGLLAKGVIQFSLAQKRFRVNYGLAPARRPKTMLAVPYRAKDMPSPRSEFSHPDIVIVLTCLSYYYSGLTNEQVYSCFELLDRSDQAELEYGKWAAMSPGLPPSFRHFSSINIEDKPQCEHCVFPALRHTRAVVDFYLSKVVFPKEMKQFPLKLASSGWDMAKAQKHPLTGFSGTNDSKGVLPLSVTALDLQPQTNAAVLSTLLGDENTVLEVDGGGGTLSALTEEMLLGALQQTDPPMRVILDVGAQIIESTNSRMAERLLELVPDSSAKAVIFFNDDDDLSVLLRNGEITPFLTSPFATQTDKCLVFLDQAHTRGTDLKLPSNYRAAVTLGPGVTKDTLVQACMRMRKLGQGQSVTFIVSPEMQKRIRTIRNLATYSPLTVADVIAWAISETWDEAVRSVPLWAAQGIRHIRQEAIWQKAENEGGFSSCHARAYLEPEGLSLEQRYRPIPSLAPAGDTEIAALMADLDLEDNSKMDTAQLSAIRQKLIDFSNATRSNTASSTLQEEQERELAPEIEEEREVARPPPRAALSHRLHKDVLEFIRTGNIRKDSTAFIKPFSIMSTTTAASLFQPNLDAFPSDLLVTRDFARTVEESGPCYHSDSYQRDVQWILVSSPRLKDRGLPTMVIISQWEANQLKVLIDKHQKDPHKAVLPPVTMHAYSPRPALTFRTMEDLKVYTVPEVVGGTPWWKAPRELVMQLNLFAGQLYLRDFEEYTRLCRYLGLAYTANDDDEVAVPLDGFVGRRRYPECEFESSPVSFLSKLFNNIRRDCMGGIEKTHMGRILAGEILTEKDFE